VGVISPYRFVRGGSHGGCKRGPLLGIWGKKKKKSKLKKEIIVMLKKKR
jgi:hypothetical protein